MEKRAIAIVMFAALFACAASAHKPRIVEGNATVFVESPEVSQAFYGELEGQVAQFEIESASPFALYVGVLVPDLPNATKDVSVWIYKMYGGRQEPVKVLDSPPEKWKLFYEEFAGDFYYQDGEYRANATAGTYVIRVLGPNNTGKFVLAVGETEEFGTEDMMAALYVLPRLKQDFFGKPLLSVFEGRIGAYLIMGLAAILLAVVLLAFVLSVLLRRRPEAPLAMKVAARLATKHKRR